MRIILRSLPILLISFFIFSSRPAKAQSNYANAWSALDSADVPSAKTLFEKALKDKENREEALLSLGLIYNHNKNSTKSAEYIHTFFKESNEPYPALYAMWTDEGVIGDGGFRNQHQTDLLKEINEDPRNVGKLDGASTYRISASYISKFDRDKALNISRQIGDLQNWSLLGPFDDVMQSGFDKDFGALKKHTKGEEFTSKYWAKVKWFVPSNVTDDGYFSKVMYFKSYNSIIYTQTYVYSETDQDVFLKMGYSGTMKLWVNDSLIYQESEVRDSEIDNYRFKLKLKAGHNRVLVQLGEDESVHASFCIRLTDLNHKVLKLKTTPFQNEYNKGLDLAEPIDFYLVDYLKEKVENEKVGLLYHFLLVEAYKRNKQTDDALEVLSVMEERSPKNFLVMRQRVLLNKSAGNNTSQNLTYEEFKKYYPDDIDILNNEISNEFELGNKEKAKELIAKVNDLYPDVKRKLKFDIQIARHDNDIEKVLDLSEEMYKKYPEDYDVMSSKYELLKHYYKEPKKAKALLENFLKDRFDYNIQQELLNTYFNEGNYDKAIGLIDKGIYLAPYDINAYRQKVNVLSRKQRYEDAIKVSKDILKFRPSDYNVLEDIGVLYKYQNNLDSAVHYYSEAVRYFPFTFRLNESIYELRDEVIIGGMIPEPDIDSVIADFNENFEQTVKKPYDIVYDNKTMVLFSSSAKALYRTYLVRVNDETGIDDLKEMTIGASANMEIYYKDLKTIKKDGNKLIAERNDSRVVFTNLEVGDFVLVSFYEKQVNGGKTSLFNYDQFGMDAYYPIYHREYSVLAEEGLEILHTVSNGEIELAQSVKGNFTEYKWVLHKPEAIPTQTEPIPYSDIARTVHIASNYSWNEISQWYEDLTEIQSTPDYTIKEIQKELFGDGEELSDLEKYEKIYQFVTENIQYSSVDFRQSGYIPQKASKVYQTKLGDCKDMSILFAAIARAEGLSTNLVLVNTSNNGQKDVVQPSLNFNHCIVKIYPENSDPMYLELTAKELDFGHLDYYHLGAATLEIKEPKEGAPNKLEFLQANNGYKTVVIRDASISIAEDLSMEVAKKVRKTGVSAASFARSYFYVDQDEKDRILKNVLQDDFESPVKLLSFEAEDISPRVDTSRYTYSYTVESDVQKVGSFRSIKLPFSDNLATLTVFDDEDREVPFYFVKWENYDGYYENMDINLPAGYEFFDLPKNVTGTFNGCDYSLEFEVVKKNQLRVKRGYSVTRKNIQPEQFDEFRQFITDIYEAETTQLLFKASS